MRNLLSSLALAGMVSVLIADRPGHAQSRPTPESERSAPGEPPRPAPPGSPPAATPPNSTQPPSKGARPADPAPGKAGPQAKGKQQPKGPPPIAVQQHRTPAQREKALNDLYALLATSEDAEKAKTVSVSIERLWLNAGSDTITVLMERASQAQQAKKPDLALKLLDAVVDLAPDYAEGWNRRAYVHFAENNVERALGDLRRVLALDPNHFRALDGLAHILKEVGQKKAALAAVRKLLEVHPHWDGAKSMQDELAREVEGQSL